MKLNKFKISIAMLIFLMGCVAIAQGDDALRRSAEQYSIDVQKNSETLWECRKSC